MSVVIPDPATTDWVPLNYGAAIQTNVPSCRAYKASAFAAPLSAWGVPPLDTERWDTDAMHDTVTNNTRFTVRTAGKYVFVGTGMFSPNATGSHRLIAIRLNGGTMYDSNGGPPSSGGAVRASVTSILDCVAGDYVELVFFQDGVANLNVTGEAGGGPELEACYLGPGLLGRGVQNLTGTYLTRPAANTVPPGSTYFATDTLGTWLSDGVAWTLIQQRAPLITSATMSAAPFSTPYDGQEIVLTDSLVSSTFAWRLRYNASATSAYKWDFVGGSPITAAVDTSTNNTSTAYADLPGGAVVLARAGDYEWLLVARTSLNVTGIAGYVGVRQASGAASDNNAVVSYVPGAAGTVMTHSVAKRRFNGMPAGETLVTCSRVSSGNMDISFRNLEVRPVRVA